MVNEDSTKSFVGHWSPSLCRCQLLVDDVGIDDGDLEHPEKHLPPPFHTLVEEAVIAGKLVQLVDS